MRSFHPAGTLGSRGALLLLALAALSCSKSTPGPQLHVPSPDWSKQIIYFVLTDRFANGDPTNDDQKKGEYDPSNYDKYSGGDLQGVIDRLDYIQGLGATAVWVTPPVANMWWDPLQGSGGYHGYWARHLKKVDEHAGTLDTYKALSAALHARGMYLIQDVVPNHMGNFFQYTNYDPADPAQGYLPNTNAVPTSKPEQAPFDQDDPRDPAQRAAGIYHWTPSISDYTDPNQELNYQVSDLDDLNSGNATTRAALRDSYGYWIKEVGVDAFRVDTVKYVPHAFWNDFFHSTDSTAPGMMSVAAGTGRSNFLAFGEVYETSDPFDDTADKKVGSYTGTAAAPELPALLAYPLYAELGRVFAAGKPTSYLTYRLGKLMDPAINANPFITPTFIDNHDVRRFLSVGTQEALLQALSFIFTAPGIPVVYYGTEQGLTETRAAMFKGGYKSTGKTNDTDLFDAASPLYARIKALADLRKQNPVLTGGAIEVLQDSGVGAGAFVYRRTLGSDSVLVMMNTADEGVLASGVDSRLAGGTGLDILYSEQLALLPKVGAGGLMNLLLPPRSVIVARGNGQVVTPPAPATSITVGTAIDGQTFTGDVTVTGTISPANAPLQMVLDGYIDRANPVNVNPDGTWSIKLPISLFPTGMQQHSVAFWAPGDRVSTARMRFTSNVTFNGFTITATDPTGDDTGPAGHRYLYPSEGTFHHQMDISGVALQVGPTTLNLNITMADFSTVWKPPNGYDHVAFNIYFALPGQSGATVMPHLQASTPAGFSWSFNQFSYGWDNTMYTSAGATADTYGAPAVPPAVAVNAATKTISFTYDRNNFGISTWTGVKVYISTWDFDGIGAQFRPITPAGDLYKMGGGQPTDPMIMDDLPPITITAPP